jgi:hypothetical protein
LREHKKQFSSAEEHLKNVPKNKKNFPKSEGFSRKQCLFHLNMQRVIAKGKKATRFFLYGNF